MLPIIISNWPLEFYSGFASTLSVSGIPRAQDQVGRGAGQVLELTAAGSFLQPNFDGGEIALCARATWHDFSHLTGHTPGGSCCVRTTKTKTETHGIENIGGRNLNLNLSTVFAPGQISGVGMWTAV